MNKKNIVESFIFTLIATVVYGAIIYILEKGDLDVVDFIGFGVYAIIMFISNIFIMQKHIKKEEK